MYLPLEIKKKLLSATPTPHFVKIRRPVSSLIPSHKHRDRRTGGMRCVVST